MKHPTPLIVSAMILTGCISSNPGSGEGQGDFLCIPDEYQVSIGASDSMDDQFDTEGGGYNTSILLSEEYMARAISDYQARVQVGESERHQSLYVMLAPESNFRRPLSDIQPTKPLAKNKYLLREDTSDLTWEVLEKKSNKLAHWGTCADQFTTPSSFDCQRALKIHDLVLTYTIDRSNLDLYPQIDELLREKVSQWRCSSGTIPVER
ncbi:hypothetical protein QQM79_06910 [Marinobacteraceae bacterium S3BR75-40.1]